VVTINSLQGHGRGKRGSKINGGHYEKVNGAWWKKGRPREKVCDISVIWLWGIVMQDLKFVMPVHFSC
jgi:hypothetical protein